MGIGTIPPTALLLTKNSVLIGEFESYSSIGHHLGISIDDKGKITFQGEVQTPSYVMDTAPDPYRTGSGFTKHEAINDWCRHHMKNHLGSYKLYRYLKGV